MRQVVEGHPRVFMVRAQRFLVDCQDPLIERLGLSILAPGLMNRREGVKGNADPKIIRPKHLLQNRQSLLGKWFGLRMPFLTTI